MNHIEIKEIAKNVLIVDAKSLARELMNAITKLVNYLITRNVFKSPKNMECNGTLKKIIFVIVDMRNKLTLI